MSSTPVNSSAARALTPGAIALMLMLCLSWGFNQIAVKLALPDVPPMMQALIRSAGALPVMLAVGWFRGVKVFERDGSLRPRPLAGAALCLPIAPVLFRVGVSLPPPPAGVSFPA